MRLTKIRTHPAVIHPRRLLSNGVGRLERVSDLIARHLAVAFGLVWTIWIFMVYPLVLLAMPPRVQQIGGYLSSGWIQLWALPLFVYVGNKLQANENAQSDAQHVALTHIALTSDQILLNQQEKCGVRCPLTADEKTV